MRLISRALVALLGGTLAASASTLAGPVTTFGPVSGGGAIITTAPGNNNAPGGSSPNVVVVAETVNSLSNAWGFSFSVLPNAGSTEYAFTKTVTNNTSLTWNSYQLSFAAGGIFDPNATTSSVFVFSWDSDSLPTLTGPGTSGQTLGTVGPAYYSWNGLNILPGDSISIQFSLDTCANCSGGWQIQQYASASGVPEPGAYALMGSGLLFVGLRLRKKIK